MRRLGNWSVGLGTLAFAALPMLASGCADQQAATVPVADKEPADDLGELSDDLGAPMESGSGLGLPEAGSGLGLPESGSGLGLPESGSGLGLSDGDATVDEVEETVTETEVETPAEPAGDAAEKPADE